MKKTLLTILLLSLFSAFAFSQSSDKLLEKLVEKKVLTQDEANELKKEEKEEAEKKGNVFQQVGNAVTDKSSDQPVALASVLGLNSQYFQLSGYTQFLYDYQSSRESHHNFKAKNVYLTANGKINKYLRYSFMVELTSPRMIEYWAEFTLHPALNLKLGQQKTPLTIESTTGAAAIETVNYSRVVTSLMGYGDAQDAIHLQNGANNLGRDLGLQASGSLIKMNDHNLINYTVGLYQGSGMNTNSTTNNKTLVANVLLEPIKGLRLGGGGLFGEAKYAMPKDGGIAGKHVRNRWAASAEYKNDHFKVRSEYIRANDGGIKKDGVYGLAQYHIIPKKLNVLGKVDYLNNNKDLNLEVLDYTAGIGYNFFKQCYVMVNYTYSDYSNKWISAVGGKDNHAVSAQLQILF